MTKRSEELRQQLSTLLQAQAAPEAMVGHEEVEMKIALLRALARATPPSARSKTFKLKRRPRPAGRNLAEDA